MFEPFSSGERHGNLDIVRRWNFVLLYPERAVNVLSASV